MRHEIGASGQRDPSHIRIESRRRTNMKRIGLAGLMVYIPEMRTTTSLFGDLWMARSTFVGDSLTPDKLRGILSKGDTL
jgi:hypothetical protein